MTDKVYWLSLGPDMLVKVYRVYGKWVSISHYEPEQNQKTQSGVVLTA